AHNHIHIPNVEPRTTDTLKGLRGYKGGVASTIQPAFLFLRCCLVLPSMTTTQHHGRARWNDSISDCNCFSKSNQNFRNQTHLTTIPPEEKMGDIFDTLLMNKSAKSHVQHASRYTFPPPSPHIYSTIPYLTSRQAILPGTQGVERPKNARRALPRIVLTVDLGAITSRPRCHRGQAVC
ncbi:unnamed protein product, partial [Ectocarpus fasciculatus]